MLKSKKTILGMLLCAFIAICTVFSATFFSTSNIVHADSGNPETIAEVLATNPDFPTGSDSWKSVNGGMCYLYNGTHIIITNIFSQAIEITEGVVASGDNYVYDKNGVTVTFNMAEDKLVGISVSGTANYINGEYKHVHNYNSLDAVWNGKEVTITASCKCDDTQKTTLEGTYQKITDATNTEKETGKYVLTVTEGIFAGTYESAPFEVDELPSEPKSGLSTGAIVGISVGSVVVACLIAYVVMFIVWTKNGKAVKFLQPSFKWINTKIFKK